MSLVLSNSSPQVNAKTNFFDDSVNIYYKGAEDIDINISIKDFCYLVEYVLTNTDLKDLDDPRLHLLIKLKNYKLETGFRANGIRLVIKEK